MDINLIVAIDKKTNGIGKENKISWKNKADLQWFKNITIGNNNNGVIMGYNTFRSINKPLKNRINIVLTKDINKHPDLIELQNNNEYINNLFICTSIEDAIEKAKYLELESAFIIGGYQIYLEALQKDIVDILYIDYLEDTNLKLCDFDTFFPVQYINNNFIKSDLNIYKYNTDNINPIVYYRKRTSCETDYNYLKLLDEVLYNGNEKLSRAGNTVSTFGKMLSFNLKNNELPILTTKKVYTKGCIYELLWFLQGGTNIKYLIDNNTHIWDDDAYRFFKQKYEKYYKTKESPISKESFLQKVKNNETFSYSENNVIKTYTFGDLGPIYGKQWINWTGINQVENLINKLKENPNDRRLIISAWNVGELKDMGLPPCHYMSQWYTTKMTNKERNLYYNKKVNNQYLYTEEELDNFNVPSYYLSCMWMQRSVDICLGFPYDLLSYSILCNIIAKICNMVPNKIYCSLGDCHVYNNQIDNAKIQLIRNPYKYYPAHIEINNNLKNIKDLKFKDIKITNYNSYPSIKYPLSVGL